MSRLGDRPLVRRRYTPDTWVDGEVVRGTTTDSTFQGSVQPLPERDRQVLPEGLRGGDLCKVYCDAGTLRAESAHTGDKADEVIKDGVRYQVLKVEPEHPLIAHQKVWLMAVQEGTP